MKTRKLTRQYCNTRQIAELAARILGNPGCESAGRRGEEPQFVEARLPEQIEKAAEKIAELVASGVAMSEIAVLYVKKRSAEVEHIPDAVISALESRGVLARWSARDAESKRNYDVTTDSVTISTIHSAKGLDFGHVFLLDMDGLDPVSGRGLAYVGMTRARETLAIFYSDKNWKASFFGAA